MNTDLIIRTSAFLGIFAIMGVWELLAPRRQLQTSKKSRWIVNLTMTGLNAILVRVIFASGPLGMAILAKENA